MEELAYWALSASRMIIFNLHLRLPSYSMTAVILFFEEPRFPGAVYVSTNDLPALTQLFKALKTPVALESLYCMATPPPIRRRHYMKTIGRRLMPTSDLPKGAEFPHA